MYSRGVMASQKSHGSAKSSRQRRQKRKERAWRGVRRTPRHALSFLFLWSLGIGSATWWWGLIFGAIHGLLVLLLLALIILLYPRLSRMVGRPLMVHSGTTAGSADELRLPQMVGKPLMMVTVL